MLRKMLCANRKLTRATGRRPRREATRPTALGALRAPAAAILTDLPQLADQTLSLEQGALGRSQAVARRTQQTG
eukprot:1852946-Alexandrium_andersonii.AAC.1